MKRWIYLLGAMMLGLCISFTSYAADAEYRTMHGEQDALLTGIIKTADESGYLVDVEEVIDCKAENTKKRQIPIDEVPEMMLITEIKYLFSYHGKQLPEEGDEIVISVNKTGDKWEQAWVALEVQGTQLATIETAKPENMTSGEYAWQIFLRSEGEKTNFAYEYENLYLDGELVYDHEKYHKDLVNAQTLELDTDTVSDIAVTEESERSIEVEKRQHVEVKDKETMVMTNDGAMAISIIGGADGPTSVFLAGKVGAGTKTVMWIAVVALIALLGVCIWLFSNKHDN